MIIIGEKINGTRKAVAKAIRERDADTIKRLAEDQTAAGSHYLDANAGTPPEREPEDMIWLVEIIQSVSDLPICLDSANPQALLAGLKTVRKPPMLNSLSGEKSRVKDVLPLAVEYQTHLVILALDDATGIPNTGSGRLAIIDTLVKMALEGGLAQEQLFIDPLVTTIATGAENAKITFDTIRQTKTVYPKAHITSGLSNISFGMPLRGLINRAFITMCIKEGLDSAIIDPNDSELMAMILTAEMLMGLDPYCQNFSRAYRSGKIGPPKE